MPTDPALPALKSSPSHAIEASAAPPLVQGREKSRVLIKNKGRVLDLFSGTGSVSNRMNFLGYSVVTVDLDRRVDPVICEDFMQWDYTKFLPGHFKIICASVPCAEYSLAKTTAPRDLERADALVKRVLKLVQYFSPKVWWIENPRTGLLKTRPFMKNLPFVDIDYCQFSDWGYQKPTRFWGSPNLGLLAHVRCPGRTCLNVVVDDTGVHHREKLGGNHMKFNTTQKGRIPPKVIDYLLREGEYAPSKGKKGVKSYRFRGYKMDPSVREKMMGELGVPRSLVKVDLFASQSDAQKDLFMTESDSAWFYDWGNFVKRDKFCGQTLPLTT